MGWASRSYWTWFTRTPQAMSTMDSTCWMELVSWFLGVSCTGDHEIRACIAVMMPNLSYTICIFTQIRAFSMPAIVARTNFGGADSSIIAIGKLWDFCCQISVCGWRILVLTGSASTELHPCCISIMASASLFPVNSEC